jgi:hypothetical protein
LNFLPLSYQSLSWIYLHSDRKTITYNDFVNALLIDDLQTKMIAPIQPSNASRTVLNVTRGRSQQQIQRDNGKGSGSKGRSKSRGKSQDKKKITCWKCGKMGHMKKDCRPSGKANNTSIANVVHDYHKEDLLSDNIDL